MYARPLTIYIQNLLPSWLRIYNNLLPLCIYNLITLLLCIYIHPKLKISICVVCVLGRIPRRDHCPVFWRGAAGGDGTAEPSGRMEKLQRARYPEITRAWVQAEPVSCALFVCVCVVGGCQFFFFIRRVPSPKYFLARLIIKDGIHT